MYKVSIYGKNGGTLETKKIKSKSGVSTFIHSYDDNAGASIENDKGKEVGTKPKGKKRIIWY